MNDKIEKEEYTLELENCIICWDEKPETDVSDYAKKINDNYMENINSIAIAINKEIGDFFGKVFSVDELISKLGKPQIYIDNGQAVYCDHELDQTHIISFEFLADDFSNIHYISIDG